MITLVILGVFSLFVFFRSNIRALMCLMGMVTASCATMAYISFNYASLNLDPVTWLYAQSLCLYLAYLTFQTLFFDRFIACFHIKGNVGFFIAVIDFIGYLGTVSLLSTKELLNFDMEWFALYNHLACGVGAACTILFSTAAVFIYRRYRTRRCADRHTAAPVYADPMYNTI